MTRDELLDRMSSAEMTEWMAEFKIRAAEAEQARASSRNRRR